MSFQISSKQPRSFLSFDTVNHQILIDKLNFYGIRGIPLAWLTSYLDNRQQYVMVNGHVSSNNTVVCGVPQGSVLGPLLFLLYINDLFVSSNYLSFILFADDTNIFLRHKDLATLTRMVNQELSHVSSWFNANKLTVHPDKSRFIIFHPRRKQINPSELNILINNTPVAQVQEHKFLGIIILTRSRFNLHKMSLRYQFAISSQAPTIWNDIPLTVRDSLTTTNFKKKLKLHFLSLN